MDDIIIEDNLEDEVESWEPNFWERLFSNKMAVFGATVILILFITAIFAPLIAPYPYDAIDLPQMLKAPNSENILGTDEFGRDIFSRIVYGSRISLQVGFIAVGISLVIGTILGALAGYYGGITDYIISGITDIAYSFPISLLAIAFVAALGRSLTNLIFAVALVSWSGYARLVRGQFISLKNREFIEATKILGMSDARIIFKHMLPNSMAPVIVLTTLEIPKAIIVESSLSFLGLGVPPPAPSWGSIMSSGRAYIMEAPWVSIFPGLVMALAVLGFNLFGDALRDTLDPRLKD
ncbi:MAG TPA: ABC transporter permease [Sedimentibacter sp.]|nr:ABC transporter permease [Sedimentibacter sp.]NLA12624.1 ABC transporter permease [Tissierellia bacterium]HOA20213.1 ABC transporter permease [Sedimentibacter sp.]HOG62574.1 ABC transporter permease [Sedimentibacter sp.]HOT21151.1 ABC transporter permease [Sedimentibacter sp.]